MARRKKSDMLALPAHATAQMKKDVKTLSGIVDRWSSEAEEVIKSIFAWGKKHKFLVVVVGVLIFAGRYLFSEQLGDEDQDE